MTAITLVRCPGCELVKEPAAFHRDRRRKSGIAVYCKSCATNRNRAWRQANGDRYREYQRDYYHRKGKHLDSTRVNNWRAHLKKRYGITPEDYDLLFAVQGGVCAMCGDAKPLVVDHDHETGKVRGLLCNSCNVALGFIERIPGGSDRISAYITRNA